MRASVVHCKVGMVDEKPREAFMARKEVSRVIEEVEVIR